MNNNVRVTQLRPIENTEQYRTYEVAYEIDGEKYLTKIEIVLTSVGEVIRIPDSFWKHIQLNGVLADRFNQVIRRTDSGEKINLPFLLGNLDEVYSST